MGKVILLIVVVGATLLLMCFFILKITERIINIITLIRERREHGSLPRSEHVVFNKKTGKLENDSRINLPFE